MKRNNTHTAFGPVHGYLTPDTDWRIAANYSWGYQILKDGHQLEYHGGYTSTREATIARRKEMKAIRRSGNGSTDWSAEFGFDAWHVLMAFVSPHMTESKPALRLVA